MEDYGSPQDKPAAPSGASTGISRPGGWEQGVLEKLVLGLVEEKRRARRWSIFFRLLVLALVGIFVVSLASRFGGDIAEKAVGKHTALVELSGVIDARGESSAEHVVASLRAAFKNDNTVGVVLRINSPGGSPVQSGIIHDEIKRLRAKYPAIPLHAVVEEICASGGYYVATAADRIYVDKASIVGSIGVLMDGFGFVGVMDKVGVERRLLIAGRNKGFLDSFSPVTDEQKDFALKMLNEIHQQFIDVVKKGRGDRLKETPDTFSGLFWSGVRSVEMGLADEIGTVDMVARDVFKAEELVDFSTKENLAERLAKKIGASAAQTMARSLQVGVQVPQLR